MPQTLTIYKQNKYNQAISERQQKSTSQLSQKNKLQRQIQILKQQVKRLKIQQLNQKIMYQDQKHYQHNNFIQNINNQEENNFYIHKHIRSQLQSEQTSNKNSRYSQSNTINFRVGKIVKNSNKINKINNIPVQFSKTLQIKPSHKNHLSSNLKNNRYQQTNSQLTNNNNNNENENFSQQTNQLQIPSTTNKKIDNHFKTIQLKPAGISYTQRQKQKYSFNKINRKVKQNQEQLKGFDPTVQSIYEDSQSHVNMNKQIKNNSKIINFNQQKGLNKQFHRSQQLQIDNHNHNHNHNNNNNNNNNHHHNHHNHKVSQLQNFDNQKNKRISSAFTSPQIFGNQMNNIVNQNNKKLSTNIESINTNNTPGKSNFKFRTRSITDQQRKSQLANNLIRLSKQQQKRQQLIQKKKLGGSIQLVIDHNAFKSRLINKYRLLSIQNPIQQAKQIQGKIIKNYYNYQLHKLNISDDKNDFTEQQLLQCIKIQKQFSLAQLPFFIDKPHSRSNSDQIMDILQRLCKKLNINFRKQQLLNKKNLIIKRYKNCLIFYMSQKQKIIWYYQGKIYIGEGNDQQESSKSGYGVEYMSEKYIYKGEFQNNKKSGKGILILQNGDIYQGQWANGQKQGYGKFYSKQNNTYYQGEYKNGKQHGNGLLKKLNDSNQSPPKNIIDFKNKNYIDYNNIQVYKGTFSNGLKHGYGIQIFKNNDKYKGQYNKGLFHGKGKYIWSNGSIFYGDFIKGIRTGSGKWMSNCLKQYQKLKLKLNQKQNQKQNQNQNQNQNQSDVYFGGYLNDKKHGTGKYIWKNGVVYQGGFEKDKKHGNGVLTNLDGRIVKGVWGNNKLIKIISHSAGDNNQFNQQQQQNQLQNQDYCYAQQQNYGVNLIENKGQQMSKPSQLNNYD